MPAARNDPMMGGNSDSTFCSDLASKEALAGTAPHAPAWVIVEYAGPWSREALSPETFSADPLGAELLRAAQILESLGAKVLLARESGATHSPLHRDSRIWIARSPDYGPYLSTIGEALDRIVGFDGGTLAELLDTMAGTPLRHSHLFICCHGKRDQCCAVKGRALLKSVKSTHPHVWECSHLGGHRFAPTALLLPRAGVFGRLTETSIDSLLDDGALGLEKLRGLSSFTPGEQVVDIAAKKLWQLPWSANLAIDRIDSDGHESTFMATAPDDRKIRCTVSESVEELPVSCGKPASSTKVWRVQDIHEE